MPVSKEHVDTEETLLAQLVKNELADQVSAVQNLDHRQPLLQEIAHVYLCDLHAYQRGDIATEWGRDLKDLWTISAAAEKRKCGTSSEDDDPPTPQNAESMSPRTSMVLDTEEARRRSPRVLASTAAPRTFGNASKLTRPYADFEHFQEEPLASESESDSDRSTCSILDLGELEDWIHIDPNFKYLRPFVQHVGIVVARLACTNALQEIHLFFGRQASHITHATTDQDSSPSSSAPSNDSQASGKSTANSTPSSRKRQRLEEDSHNDDRRAKKHLRTTKESILPAEVYKLYYACPFYQNCHERHQLRGCQRKKPSFDTVSRVK